MIRTARLACLIGLTLAAACNNNPGGSAPTVDTPLSYQEYLQLQNAFLCTMRFKCCTPAQAAALDPMKADAASCTAALNARIKADHGKELSAIARGDTRYDTVQASICLESLKSGRASCDDPDDFNPFSNACGRVLYGIGHTGSACATDLDCGLGLFCSISQGMVSGSCVALTLYNDPCDAMGPRCVAGTVCGPDAKCVLVRSPGDACTAPEQCRTFGCTAGKCDPAKTVRAAYCM